MIYKAIKDRIEALGVSTYKIAEGTALQGSQVAKYLRTGKGLGVENVEKVLAFLGGGVAFSADAARLSEAELTEYGLSVAYVIGASGGSAHHLYQNGCGLMAGSELDCHVRAREIITESGPGTCSNTEERCRFLIPDGRKCDYNFPCNSKVLKKGD